MSLTAELDPFDRRLALTAHGLLATFNSAGVLEAADVHVATRVAAMCEETDEAVVLACALAVRALRNGSVCVDLGESSDGAPELPWPPSSTWTDAVAESRLVSARLLRVDGGRVYLDRAWQEETQVLDDLTTVRAGALGVRDAEAMERHLERFFPDSTEQRDAARTALLHRTTVVTGGPGTGKTTTIAGLLGVVLALADDAGTVGRLRIALAAPTGKAAARMSQALTEVTGRQGFPALAGEGVEAFKAVTVHRLLGWRPGSRSRFRHDRTNQLPYDVVVVDECSMLPLTLTARLLEAVRPSTRLVLVGDADQLTSVEAGAVLKDLVEGVADTSGAAVARLTHSHRFGKEIGLLADAVRRGDADEVLRLASGGDVVTRVALDGLDDLLLRQVRSLRDAALSSPAEALAAYDEHRLLCAHREGPYGASEWNRRIDRLLAAELGGAPLDRWYVGRPVIVDSNDYGSELFNGDTGVVVQVETAAGLQRPRVAFDTGGSEVRLVPTTRLSDISTAHALTVHRAQGSQFEAVTVLLPEDDSRLLSRELLYTALTRAKTRVRIVGSDEALRIAVERRAVRATGLAERLRGRGTSAGETS